MLNDYITISTTGTHDAYQNVPLSKLSGKARGDVMENLVRKVLTDITGEKTYDPDAGTTLTGKKRGRNSAPFDFYLRNRKIEVKSAQLIWNKYLKRYCAQFKSIKRNEYDDLYLALYTTSGIYIFKHDHTFGISTHGKLQESDGGIIQVCGPKNQDCIDVATNVVLEKMKSMFVKHILFDEIEVTTTINHKAYQNVPLADLSTSARGDVMENLVRKVLAEITGEKTYDPDTGTTISGKKRGRNSAPFDFYLQTRKIEVKSAQLGWNKDSKRYHAQFQAIKRNEYDDLYLALYTTSGIYIFKHDHTFGINTNGKQQESKGRNISVRGPCKQYCIDIATNVILEKMKSMHVKTIKYL